MVRQLLDAVLACADDASAGYFNAYGVGTYNTSADFFVHLGDYVSYPSSYARADF